MRDNTRGQEENSETIAVDRRTVLKGVGTAALAGPMATIGVASAQIVEVIEVEETLFGGFEADGSLPVVDELFVFVHGWFGDTTVRSQASDVLGSVEAGGYTPDAAIAIEWPATNFWYLDAEGDTEAVGAEVARLIEEFSDSGGGNVRLTGHSLGGRIVYWTATSIGSGYTIDTIGGMGAAADGSTVCLGGQWHSGIADNAGTVRNYHSQNDTTVGSAYGGIGDTALGTEGAPCGGASNYTDVDVTASVGGHLEYLGDSQVGSDLATVILND
ncbi:alpha/beta hydrolase family protein [Halocatena pleomorpha]|uniref:Alpha/beta hydrolase n=1 Tax=Halocatena pleomorpha TaxID=1785090 RepID=A0A3P3R9N7_9EURY|nr:alpha/beta hydrolase [Halocatena pleomorpha]RRJ30124.1 alpha/beta hydrolase [Halocatena pleomorpha]